jgi:hypothetical protein
MTKANQRSNSLMEVFGRGLLKVTGHDSRRWLIVPPLTGPMTGPNAAGPTRISCPFSSVNVEDSVNVQPVQIPNSIGFIPLHTTVIFPSEIVRFQSFEVNGDVQEDMAVSAPSRLDKPRQCSGGSVRIFGPNSQPIRGSLYCCILPHSERG